MMYNILSLWRMRKEVEKTEYVYIHISKQLVLFANAYSPENILKKERKDPT